MGYILITGGNFINKGAQAMVFITVDEIKKRFPGKKIIVVSDIDATSKNNNNFCFLLRDSVCLYGQKYKLIQHHYGKLDASKDASKIMKEIDMILDISGYTFGSNFGWMSSFLAAYRAKRAHKYGVPIYYLPQSFGPFQWTNFCGKVTRYCMSKWLSYAKIIFAREEEGYNLLKENFNLHNIFLSDDLVLQNKGIELSHIYHTIPLMNIPKINSGSVAILPNIRNYKYGNLPQLMQIYQTIINELLALNRTVYLVRHATEDLDFCQKIKHLYQNTQQVILLENDFTCFEYEIFIKQFDYLIASRYHAIVHAYKQGVPCLVLGWATKYLELLKKFSQEKYALDVRENIPGNKVKELILQMNVNWAQEKETILNALIPLQQKNVFDCLGAFL